MATNREFHQSTTITEEQSNRLRRVHPFLPAQKVPSYFSFGGAAYEAEELPVNFLRKPSTSSARGKSPK